MTHVNCDSRICKFNKNGICENRYINIISYDERECASFEYDYEIVEDKKHNDPTSQTIP